jgi:Amidases related to nicotinamidase
MKPALLVIDLQKAFYGDRTRTIYDSACYFINSAIPLFRKKLYPVFWIQHIDETQGAIPGAPDFDFVDSLKPDPRDYRIHKRYNDSFNKTELLPAIQKENVDTVLISGFCAEYCIISTYIGALDHDLTPILLRNGIASGSEENKRFIEDTYTSMSLDALKKFLE